MNRIELYLVAKEFSQIQVEGLIEPTTFQLACQAFYVNKWSEQIHGKMRHVIDYKPSNHFLVDGKFFFSKQKD